MDRGFMFADSIYEVMLVHQGRVCNLGLHLRRLNASLACMQIDNPYSSAQWQQHIATLLNHNAFGDASLYVQVSRGAALSRSLSDAHLVRPTVFMLLEPVPLWLGETVEDIDSSTGLTAELAADLRWQRCDIKGTGLTGNVLLRLNHEGADEVIMHCDGDITEGTASNVFAVLDGCVVTPPLSERVLAGVTRTLVLEVLRAQGIACEERHLTLEQLRAAEEIWISSTLRGLAPIVGLDDEAVANGKPGPLWRRVVPWVQKKRCQFDADLMTDTA